MLFLLTEAALNAFLKASGRELLKVMKPDIQKALTNKIQGFLRSIFQKVPYDAFIV